MYFYSGPPMQFLSGVDTERQFAELVLERMTIGAERDAIAIGRFHAHAAVEGRTHMCGLGRSRFTADDAGKLPDEGQVLRAPPEPRFGRMGQGAGNTGWEHRSRHQIDACA